MASSRQTNSRILKPAPQVSVSIKEQQCKTNQQANGEATQANNTFSDGIFKMRLFFVEDGGTGIWSCNGVRTETSEPRLYSIPVNPIRKTSAIPERTFSFHICWRLKPVLKLKTLMRVVRKIKKNELKSVINNCCYLGFDFHEEIKK